MYAKGTTRQGKPLRHPILQEPILALRRQLALLNSAEKEASLCWLQHAKICRATGHFEAASHACLEALKRRVPGAIIEHAKLMWDREQPHRAISKLQQVAQNDCTAVSIISRCCIFPRQC